MGTIYDLRIRSKEARARAVVSELEKAFNKPAGYFQMACDSNESYQSISIEGAYSIIDYAFNVISDYTRVNQCDITVEWDSWECWESCPSSVLFSNGAMVDLV